MVPLLVRNGGATSGQSGEASFLCHCMTETWHRQQKKELLDLHYEDSTFLITPFPAERHPFLSTESLQTTTSYVSSRSTLLCWELGFQCSYFHGHIQFIELPG